MAFEVDPRSVSKESLKPAAFDTKTKEKGKTELKQGDQCVYPSDVAVMELKRRSKGACIARTRYDIEKFKPAGRMY